MGGIETINKIRTPPTQEIKKEETIDQILQSKISDQDTLNKIKPILEDIQKSFSQPINGYIKTIDELELSTLADANDNDKKKMIEVIDLFFNKNKTPEIISTIEEHKEIKEEHKEIKEEHKEIKEENKEIKEEWFDILESRKKTKESYDALDKSKYPVPTEEEIKIQKANIQTQTQRELEAKWLNIEDYSKFLIMEKKYEKQLRKEGNTSFLDNLKELKQWLGEVTTMTETTDRRHTDLIVNNNPSLTSYTQQSATLNKLTIPKIPEFKEFEKEFKVYVKLIPDEKIRKNIEKNKNLIKEYKEIYDKDAEDARDIEGQKAYEEYTNAIDDVKEKLPDKTQAIAKQRVLWSCITGLAKYFDTSTINKENFANDFDIDTQEGFHIQKGTGESETNDDILYINGHINGNSIGFYYNLTNPDAQLQSDDFLHFNKETESFAFGVKWWGQNRLGVKLPTIATLSNEAQMIIDKEFTTELEKANTMDEFEASFKDKISAQLLKNYGQEALVKTRVERDIEKNITTQTVQNTFFPEAIRTELNRDNIINKTTEHKPWKIMEIWDKSTENMRSDELRTLRWLIQRLDPLISKEHHPNLETKRKKLLQSMEKERSAVTYTQDRGKYVLKFLKQFSHADKIDLQNLETFIISLEKEESISENIKKFSREFQTTEDSTNADSLLEHIA